MRVGFYLDIDDPEYLDLAALAIASVRRVMPAAVVVQLTTPGGPRLAVDERFERFAAGPYGLRRAMLQAKYPDPILVLDVDAMVRSDVSRVWEQDFDVAIPVVDDPYVKYTGAVMFQRNPSVWLGWILHPIWDAPCDTRTMLQAWTSYLDAWPGGLLRLSDRVFERLPLGAEDPCSGAAIVHFRGPRKRWAGATS